MVSYLPITSRAKVGDFGAGSGHYSIAVAKRLGSEGALYALDAFTPVLDKLRRESAPYAPSVYTLQADFNEHIPLRDNLLNAAILANVLHQVKERNRFLSELARVVAPGGSVLVVDWASSFKNMGPTAEMALTPGEALRLFESAGFATGQMLPAGTHHFAFIATERS